MLAERLLKHSDNLSRTMQATAMPVVEAKHLAELCVEVLQQMKEIISLIYFGKFVYIRKRNWV